MAWYDRILGRQPTATTQPKAPPAGVAARARVSDDHHGGFWGGFAVYLSPRTAENEWRTLDLSDQTLARIGTRELKRILADVSPEISKADYDLRLMGNPGYTARAYRPGGGEEPVEYPQAQAALNEFIDAIARYHGGGFATVVSQAYGGAFYGGAVALELVLDRRGRAPVDLIAIEPDALEWRRVADDDRGTRWQLGQWGSDGRWIDLDIPTIAYAPLQPLPDDPRGRAMVSPAVFLALFLVGLLRDLRRVVANQGYRRDDIAISSDWIRDALPDDQIADPRAFAESAAAFISEVENVINALEPDDTYIHLDGITMNHAAAGQLVGDLGGASDVITALERMIIRALKTQPLLMGINEAASETHANRQWEIYAAGVRALQTTLADQLARLLELALRVQGIAAEVVVEFRELRASERLRDAQTTQMEIANARAAYDAGFVSQDEAANMAVGHDADAPAPRASGGALPVATQIPEESERAAASRAPIARWREVIAAAVEDGRK